MAFNKDKFLAQEFEPRIAYVEVPGLAEWFTEEGGEPEKLRPPSFKVRGQTASEMARAFEASSQVTTIDSVLKSLSENTAKVDEIREILGITTDTPADIVKRLNQMETCCLEPEFELSECVKFAEVYPVEFYILTSKIVELTGLGMDLKK